MLFLEMKPSIKFCPGVDIVPEHSNCFTVCPDNFSEQLEYLSWLQEIFNLPQLQMYRKLAALYSFYYELLEVQQVPDETQGFRCLFTLTVSHELL